MSKPYKIFAEVLEGSALDQFHSALKEDFSVKGALMPDAHTGYSLPIGAVVATDGVILPAWVGYDIGCGMCALKTSFSSELVRENAQKIYEKIYEVVPVGVKVNDRATQTYLNPNDLTDIGRDSFDNRGAFYALGTLGGGNHFIELGVDENDSVWIIIHSGSRGVGHGTAQRYMKLASNSNKAKEGHYFFTQDSELGQKYINDLNWCLEYALENRKEMIRRVEGVVSKLAGGKGDWDNNFINRNHNHAEFNGQYWIHRKGATHAELGMRGVIPGNMRDGSFIVTGKGNADSLCSSSHGAGRVLGRKEAKRTLDVNEFAKEMEGITARVGEGTLDESPFAYKNIFEVMELQKDLVDVDAYVKPLINIKG